MGDATGKKVNPAMIKWAREWSGVGVGVAMTALGAINLDTLYAMERDVKLWSIHNLRIAAMLYRVPFDVFLMDSPPDFDKPWCCKTIRGYFKHYPANRHVGETIAVGVTLSSQDDVDGISFCPFCGSRLVPANKGGE